MTPGEITELFASRTMDQLRRLDGYTREELVKIHAALNQAESRILRGWRGAATTDWSRARALDMVDEARAIMDSIKPRLTASLAATLGGVSAECGRAYSEMLSMGGRAKGVETVFLSAEQMRSFWRRTPVGGRLLRDWMDRAFDGPTTDAIQREVFAGMFEGLGYREMSRRLQEGIVRSGREADTLVSTYVHSANVHAMDAVYRRNADVLAGVRWLTTYDNRVCMRCAALSGKIYPVNDHPECPMHPRCRCVLIPETDLESLKVSPQGVADWASGVRKPPKLPLREGDFRRWMMSRPAAERIRFFGPNRYALLREGLVFWEDLVEETAGARRTARLRLLSELRGDAAVRVAAQGPNPNVNAARALAGVRAERAAMEGERHEVVARKIEERDRERKIRYGLINASRAAELLAEEKWDEARTLGARALEDILRASGLLGERFKGGVKVAFAEMDDAMTTGLQSGKITIDTKDRKTRLNGVTEWNPMKRVLGALRKIHRGTPLDVADEAALQGLFHEIQHTRQHVDLRPSKLVMSADGTLRLPQNVSTLMETVNDWTARRNYHSFLKKLGAEPIMFGKMRETGFGYARYVKNFDTLLVRLGIKDSRSFCDRLTRINETEMVDTFNVHVAKLLREMKMDKTVSEEQIREWLKELHQSNRAFKELLK